MVLSSITLSAAMPVMRAVLRMIGARLEGEREDDALRAVGEKVPGTGILASEGPGEGHRRAQRVECFEQPGRLSW